jgi:hypothetical protein
MRKFHVVSLLLAITLTGCGNVSGTLKWASQSPTSISDYEFKSTQEQALLASSSPNCETGVPRFKAWTSGFVLDVSDPGNVVVGEIRFFFNSDRKFAATYREFQGGSESFNETVQGTFDFQTGELTVPGFGRGGIDVLGDKGGVSVFFDQHSSFACWLVGRHDSSSRLGTQSGRGFDLSVMGRLRREGGSSP